MNRGVRGSGIDDQAAVWAVRLDNDPSDADREDLEEWLRRDPRHVGALVRAQAIWINADHIGALQAGARQAPVTSPHGYATYWVSAVAATLLLAIVSVSAYSYFAGRIESNHGQIRRIALADGSHVVLDSDSTIKVHFNDRERTIELLNGEASFQVAHNKAWPFVVHARNLAVRAVGTNFTVSLLPRQISVTVAEGVVEVKGENGKAEIVRHMVSRNKVLVAPAAGPVKVADLRADEVARRLAWRDGLLVFNGESLSEAALEVNKYASEPVVIDDDRLGERAFVGVFHVGNSRAFADSAAAAFDAKVTEEAGALHVSRE
jgi:transmembrane sensor